MKGYEYLLRGLNEEGFRKSDEGNYFSFKYEGNTYIVFKNDSPYLQVLLLLKADGYSRTQMLEACNKLNDDKFVVKFTVHDSVIWCSYEFKPSDETTNDEFDLILTLLDKGSDELFAELNK